MTNEPIHFQDPNSLREPYFYFSSDAGNKIRFVSVSVREVLGTPPLELVGKDYNEIFGRAILLSDRNGDYGETTAENPSGNRQKRLVLDASGNQRVLDIQIQEHRDAQGKLVSRNCLAQDITKPFAIQRRVNKRLVQIESEIAPLSAREQQVLDLVLCGELNKSIAKTLEISERAVERIRSRCTKKYSVDSTAQLVSKAAELKLLKWILTDEWQGDLQGELMSATATKKQSIENSGASQENVPRHNSA